MKEWRGRSHSTRAQIHMHDAFSHAQLHSHTLTHVHARLHAHKYIPIHSVLNSYFFLFADREKDIEAKAEEGSYRAVTIRSRTRL